MKYIYSFLVIVVLFEIFIFSLIGLSGNTGWNILWMVLSVFALYKMFRLVYEDYKTDRKKRKLS